MRLLTLVILIFSLATSNAQPLFVAKQPKQKFGYIDSLGNYAIKPQFDNAFPFHGNHAVVQLKKKWGVIDRSGRAVIPIVYEDAHEVVKEGSVTLKKNGKWGVLDINQNEVIPFVHEYLSIFNEGYIVATRSVTKPWGKTNDVAIYRKDGTVALDFESYTLPGVITKKQWSLGRWPIVRSGYIELRYDGSFDMDFYAPPAKDEHQLVMHNVPLGLPGVTTAYLRPNEPVNAAKFFTGGMLPILNDRGQTDTLKYDPWSPDIDYYIDDHVTINGEVYLALRDNRGKHSLENPDEWMDGGKEILERFSISLHDANLQRFTYLRSNRREPWDRYFDYYAGDEIEYDGYLYRADRDNRGELPTLYNQRSWTMTGTTKPDTVGAAYRLSGEPLAEGGQHFYSLSSDALLLVNGNMLKLVHSGFVYPLTLKAESYKFDQATISKDWLCIRSAATGKFGFIDLVGNVKMNFDYDDLSALNGNVAAAKQNGKYGVVNRNGKWLVQPSYEYLAASFNSVETGTTD